MFVHRKHITPSGYKKHIYDLYQIHIEDNDVVPTTFEMNKLIRRFWRMEDVWCELEYLVPVPSYEHILEACQSESMDQYYKDIKPSNKKKVRCKKTKKKSTCPICMEAKGHKIELYGCTCVFHRNCIEQWSQYSNRCPVCKSTI